MRINVKGDIIDIPPDLCHDIWEDDRPNYIEGGDFQRMGFYLNSNYNWMIGTREDGELILISLNKRRCD